MNKYTQCKTFNSNTDEQSYTIQANYSVIISLVSILKFDGIFETIRALAMMMSKSLTWRWLSSGK